CACCASTKAPTRSSGSSSPRIWSATARSVERAAAPSKESGMLLEGKRALVFGVANKRSIAWAIAQSLRREGAELAFTYQGERVEAGVRELAQSAGSSLVYPCDVQDDAQTDAVFQAVADAWGGRLDVLVHSLAFTPHEELENRYV